jgi:hypothetical protein
VADRPLAGFESRHPVRTEGRRDKLHAMDRPRRAHPKQTSRKVPLGKIIARRTLQQVRPRRTLTLEIGEPFEQPRTPLGQQNWGCPFRIKGLDGGRVRTATGIDSAQALELVFQAVRVRMEEAGNRVRWYDRPASLMFVRQIPGAPGGQAPACASEGFMVSRPHGPGTRASPSGRRLVQLGIMQVVFLFMHGPGLNLRF